ncbi:MAG: sulfatase, partial [Planctomycetales bacterium]
MNCSIKTSLAMLLTALLISPLAAAEKKTNFVFLLVDDFGWTDAGCFGSDLYRTPNIDRLAKEGMKVTNGYAACTVCSPTRAAIMSGKYPPRTGVTNWISGPNMKLKHEEVSIAEALKQGGYVSAHVGKWHLAPRGAPDVEDYYPLHQGFDVNIAGNHWGAPGSYFHPYTTSRKKMGPLPPGGKQGDFLTDRLTDETLKILDGYKDRPFLLYLPYYAVHTPIQGKPDLVEDYKQRVKPGMKHRNATYAAMMHSVDESVGRITRKLDELGIADRTVIFFTGDNGGLDRKGNPTDNAPLRAGKGSAYEGGVRVPTIVKWPGETKPGSVCPEPVISVDYYPTILEMAGIQGDAKHNANVDGMSIVPLLKDSGARLKRDAIYWHYPHSHGGGSKPHGAIRKRDWRLVQFYADKRVELYNLADDP